MSDTIQGVIVAAKRLNSSVNGNPRFDVTVRTEAEDHLILTTKSDAMAAYDVENVLRSGEVVRIGLTRARRIETISRLAEVGPVA